MVQGPVRDVAVVGGGVVGAAILFALAHRGLDAVLLEAEPDLAYSASGTSSGVLHTGFDSEPGALETRLILRSAQLRPAVLDALGIPVLHCGAVLVPASPDEAATVRALAGNAAANGVAVRVGAADGALVVPGESVTDPVAYTLALAASAVVAGAAVEAGARVTGVERDGPALVLALADGRRVAARAVVNAAGLHADDVARLVGDDSFSIRARKGEFLVFDPPGGVALDRILLPVPTKRTKGVLVFPTLDGRVVAGPTAVDLDDKDDWSVRPEAEAEIRPRAERALPALTGLRPAGAYAGLRPAGVGSNYVIGPSAVDGRWINVAAIRSTGLSASLGIAEHVARLLPGARVPLGAPRPVRPGDVPAATAPWWRRTADHRLGRAPAA